MIDVITYISDLDAFRAELEDKVVVCDFIAQEGDDFYLNVNKIPVVYKDNESVCLIRVKTDCCISELGSMVRLGECVNNEYVFDSKAKKKIYESVHDTSVKTFTDEDGSEYEYKPPYMIGVFA